MHATRIRWTSTHFRRVLVGTVATAAIFFAGNVEAGFGVSPPLIQEDKLVPGITLERIVYLVQGTPERDLPVKIVVESQIADWISFPQGAEVVIPKGVQQYPLAVDITVPDNADLGAYKGVIRLTTVPVKAEDAGEVAIAVGGIVNLDLTVGNNIIYELKSKLIKILDIKEGDDPMVDVSLINNGNAPAAPDTATFELFNKFGELRLAYAESKDFEKIPAFHEQVAHLVFPVEIHIAPGEYWGHVKVYRERELLGELRTVFNVTEKTFAEKYTNMILIGIGAVVFLLLVIMISMRSARRRTLRAIERKGGR